MYNIVLVEPEIPQNTGNIVRTCVATGCSLHLVRPLGFSTDDRYLKRAGLDYWSEARIAYYDSFEELRKKFPDGTFWYFTTKGLRVYSEAPFQNGDFLVFGKETKGLPEDLLKANREQCLRIPMVGDTRSLNLSNSVAIAVYEALRQQGFKDFRLQGQLHESTWD
ncbi:MAG: tRNA (uridine(34)/cytosine(34)/5-carboxymethylaminomethyluridine(34)-2'-O)-methyltransferase TrmL [Clostridia bacterium]|nr:tRNA (uridine(34)/cytosine(34)/5-carboxymethylaminomethyluridine(34)-2'-O)-methyltransferase TrmL [Clostridia bacterium]